MLVEGQFVRIDCKENNETKKLLDGVGGLYSWYYSLVENINKEDTDPELEVLVAELIKGKTSDLEKVKALYYWTQKNIKYIAFEYALGGFHLQEKLMMYFKKNTETVKTILAYFIKC